MSTNLGAFDYNDQQQAAANAWNQQAANQWSNRQWDESGSPIIGGFDDMGSRIPGQRPMLGGQAAAPKTPIFTGDHATDAVLSTIPNATGRARILAARHAASNFQSFDSDPMLASLLPIQRQALYHYTAGRTPEDEQRDYHYQLRDRLEEERLRKLQEGALPDSVYNHYDDLTAQAKIAQAKLAQRQSEIESLQPLAEPTGGTSVDNRGIFAQAGDFLGLRKRDPSDFGWNPTPADPKAVEKITKARRLFQTDQAMADAVQGKLQSFGKRKGLLDETQTETPEQIAARIKAAGGTKEDLRKALTDAGFSVH
jgi:hypothetical protein